MDLLLIMLITKVYSISLLNNFKNGQDGQLKYSKSLKCIFVFLKRLNKVTGSGDVFMYLPILNMDFQIVPSLFKKHPNFLFLDLKNFSYYYRFD